MKMLNYLIIITFFLGILSCGSSDDPIPEPEPTYELSASPLSLNFEADGGNQSISITSNIIWNIRSSVSWCNSTIQTSKGNANITINAAANDVEEVRTATITITAPNVNDIIISVSQAAKEPDPVEPEIADYIEPDMTGMSSNAIAIASNIFLGWNLGNTLEATGGEMAWGNPKTSNELIVEVKELGISAIRLPCSWDQYIEDQSTYKIKSFWMERVTEVVDYCVDNDLYVVLNIHWDGGWMENNITPEKETEVGEKLAAIWKQIALNFRDYDEHLLFACANEPNAENQEQIDILAAHMQTFVNTVRGTGGRNFYRNLVIQAPLTSTELAQEYMTMPNDSVENRMLAEVHYYTPWQFCGLDEDANWGKAYYFWGEPYHLEGASERYPSWDCEEEYMETQFSNLKNKFVDNGIPVILGEFAALRRTFPGNDLWQKTHDESRAYFYTNITERAKNNGIVPFLWDTGAGIIDRNDFSVVDEIDYNALIDGANKGTYPF